MMNPMMMMAPQGGGKAKKKIIIIVLILILLILIGIFYNLGLPFGGPFIILGNCWSMLGGIYP